MTGTLDKQTLADLKPGESSTIITVGNNRGSIKRRLIDMGLTPGTKVTVIKSAPLGDPVEVMLRGYELSLRKEDLSQITIGDVPAKTYFAAHLSNDKEADKELHINNEVINEAKMTRAHLHEHEKHWHQYNNSAHDKRPIRIALAGNPNAGKTTLFNALTGSNQYVGNWPGVTVEKKEGAARLGRSEATIVDLPGIYSLSPYSIEEIVSRDYIISPDGPDVIINIVDATNLERNMYLTIQLLELEKPMIMALNFMDESRAAGDFIDINTLSKAIGIPIVPIVAKNGENIQTLLEAAHKQIHVGFTLEPDDLYDSFTHETHHAISAIMHDNAYEIGIPAHWASIKLLEGDGLIKASLKLTSQQEADIEKIASEYEKANGGIGDRETLIADSRYSYIEKSVALSVIKGDKNSALTLTQKIDKVATGKYTAIPAFLLVMFAMFNLTFGSFGSFLSDAVAYGIEMLSSYIGRFLESINVAEWLVNLVTGGIFAGVGGVLSFLPQISILFFFLSLLEDSGYMARAAFIMDRLLRRFGLSGKAFIPMLMGFGCSVPAIMGSRTMESEKDRRMTIMLVPFMSCSAKLPVYGLIASAFFGAWAGIAIFSLYIIGLLFGILSGVIFRKTLFSGDPAPFVMELPPYRIPSVKSTFQHVWERVSGFITRAGTVILLMSIIIWSLEYFDLSLHIASDISQSILAKIGGFIAPAFIPLGFGTWQASIAILTGLIAKEAVVASMSMFYGFSLTADSTEIARAMTGFTPLSAFSLLIFILLYVPCVAAVSAIYKEMNSLKWTLISVAWQIGIAYLASLLFFQASTLLVFH